MTETKSPAPAVEAIVQRLREDTELRDWLWVNHGCSVAILYGDDGERQCNALRHGALDFKRDPLSDLIYRSVVSLQQQLGEQTARVNRWRGWAQFVYLGGGPAEGTDNELQKRVCGNQDEHVAAARRWLEPRAEAAEARAEQSAATVRVLREAIATFRSTAGRHEGKHDSGITSCHGCWESYCRAEEILVAILREMQAPPRLIAIAEALAAQKQAQVSSPTATEDRS